MKIIMLMGIGSTSNIIYNFLSEKIDLEAVIFEEPKKKNNFLKRRIKRLGLFRVVGQIFFKLLIVPFLRFFSKKRIKEIYTKNNLNSSIDIKKLKKCFYVENASNDKCVEIIKSINPDLVLINGTTILKENVLSCTNAKFINIHAGITPKYRGCHGAYWALYNKDRENCGVTVHFVDKGIDTGSIIYQERIYPTKKDNFVTYPLLQLSAALDIFYQSIKDIENNCVKIKENNLPSSLYYHPTFFQYLYGLIFKHVK